MTSTLVDDGFHRTFREAQDGQPAALRALVEEFTAPIEYFLRRRRVSDPESTANSVLERALRSGDADRMVHAAAFRSYVFAIARNEVVNQHRYHGRRVTLDLVDDPADAGSWTTQTAPAAETQVISSMAVDELLAHVSDEQAEVIELRVLEGQTLEATAQILGKSVPAVTSLQYRGLARLRQAVSVVVALVVVLVVSRLLDRDTLDAPVISDDTGVVDVPMVDPDRLEGSMPDVESVGAEEARAIGGGTADAPMFAVHTGSSVLMGEPADPVWEPKPISTPPAVVGPISVGASSHAEAVPTADEATPGAHEVRWAAEPTAAAASATVGSSVETVELVPTKQPKGNARGIEKSAGCDKARGRSGKSPATCAESLADLHAAR